jgi:zinc-ribbon family
VFLLFGFGTKQKYLGPGQTRTCPRCSNTTQWERVRQFKQFSVFLVPIARWGRQQLETCPVCGAAVEA